MTSVVDVAISKGTKFSGEVTKSESVRLPLKTLLQRYSISLSSSSSTPATTCSAAVQDTEKKTDETETKNDRQLNEQGSTDKERCEYDDTVRAMIRDQHLYLCQCTIQSHQQSAVLLKGLQQHVTLYGTRNSNTQLVEADASELTTTA